MRASSILPLILCAASASAAPAPSQWFANFYAGHMCGKDMVFSQANTEKIDCQNIGTRVNVHAAQSKPGPFTMTFYSQENCVEGPREYRVSHGNACLSAQFDFPEFRSFRVSTFIYLFI